MTAFATFSGFGDMAYPNKIVAPLEPIRKLDYPVKNRIRFFKDYHLPHSRLRQMQE